MAIWFLRLGVLYLLIGIAMGMEMAATHNFALMPVHAHVNLLGWVTSTVMWLVYRANPQMANNVLAKIHLYLFHGSLPIMSVALAFFLLGNAALEPLVAGTSALIAISAVCFAINVWRNVKM